MLKNRNHCYSAISLLVLLGWMIVTPATAQVREAKLGTYDEATRIFICTDGGFQISFPERPKETLENTTKNEIPAFEGYDFGDEKGVGISEDQDIIAVAYSESARLRTTSLPEQRRLAEAFFKSLQEPGLDPDLSLKRREIKVPGASFAVEYVGIKEVAPTDFEEGTFREFRMRILIAGTRFYMIIIAGDSDTFKMPEVAGFADSFKLLNAPDSETPKTTTVDTSSEIEGVAKFTSEEDQFRVDMPGTPELEVVAEKSGGSQRHWILFSPDSIRYAVIVESVELQGEEIDRFLGLFRANKILENGESKDLRADEKLELADGVKAVEIEMPLNGQLREVASIRTRFFVTNGRVYILSAAGRFADVRGEQANHFFDSFEIITGKSAPVPEKSPSPLKAGTLRNFTSVEDGFGIKLPTEPKREVAESKDDSGEPFSQTQYSSVTATGTYLVSLQSSGGGIASNAELRRVAFDSTRDRLAATFETNDVKEADVLIGATSQGKEFRFRLPDNRGEYRTRIFFTENAFFQIVAAGSVEFADSKQTDEIFKSFRLLNDASKSAPETELLEYSSALGGFNARLPAKPVYSRRTEKDGNGREHIQHRYLCDSDDSAVLISVTEFNGLCQNSDAQLHTMCESFVRGMAGKNQVEQFVRVQSDVNPHEWAFRHTMPEPGVKVQGRVVIANDRFYIVQAIGDAEYLGNSSTNDVVQSLGIMTEASEE